MNPSIIVPDLAVWAILDGILAPQPLWPPYRVGVPGGRDHGQRSRIGILITTLSCNTSAYSVGDMSTHLPPILLIKGLAMLTFLRGPGHYSALSSVPPPSEEKNWVLLNRILLKTQLFSSSWWKFSSLTVCPRFYLLIRFGKMPF